eukprot:3456125-Amphidinium_carterae.1
MVEGEGQLSNARQHALLAHLCILRWCSGAVVITFILESRDAKEPFEHHKSYICNLTSTN